MLKTFNDLAVGDTVYRLIYNAEEGQSETGWICFIHEHKITEEIDIKSGKLFKYNDCLGFSVSYAFLDKEMIAGPYNSSICVNKKTVLDLLQREMREFNEHHEKLIDKLL